MCRLESDRLSIWLEIRSSSSSGLVPAASAHEAERLAGTVCRLEDSCAATLGCEVRHTFIAGQPRPMEAPINVLPGRHLPKCCQTIPSW